VRITGRDLLTLDVWSSLVTRLDASVLDGGAAGGEPDEDDAEEIGAAVPLALAIDVADAEPGGADTTERTEAGTAPGAGAGAA
jgi:hypothetical protein